MSDLPSTSSSGLAPNVAGALAYVLGPLTGVVFLLLEKDNPYVRFHAAQSIMVGIGMVLLSIALSFVSTVLAVVPILGWLVALFLSLGFAAFAFILWILLMLRAFQGHEWEVPVASGYARKLIAAPAAQ